MDRDPEATTALADMDRRVDLLYNAAVSGLIEEMRADTDTLRQALRPIPVCRDPERAADRATNIGEWVVYGETARHVALNP